jgi:hypothetical protein
VHQSHTAPVACAGRTSSGKCFRLYTEEAFLGLRDHTLPEMQRSNLAWMILQLKALGIDEVMSFDFLSQPSAEVRHGALLEEGARSLLACGERPYPGIGTSWLIGLCAGDDPGAGAAVCVGGAG